MILCLDLGTKMGWAFKTSGEAISSGTINLAGKRHEGAGMRYMKLKTWLNNMHGFNHIDVLYFEEVRRHAGTTAAHVYGGLMSHLIVWCDENNVPYQSVPVGAIKKHATGKGNANKQMMIDSAIARGHEVLDDNEADAVALMYWSLSNGVDITI